jgi:hypothetical protein
MGSLFESHPSKISNGNQHSSTPDWIRMPGKSWREAIRAIESFEMQAADFIYNMAFGRIQKTSSITLEPY